MNSASAISVLFMLYSQHQDASAKYREAANLINNGKLTDYFKELADYHFGQANALQKVLEDMSPSPVPMPDMQHQKAYFTLHWEKVKDALDKEDMQRLLGFVHQNEEDLSTAYREGLKTHGLPEGLQTMLHDLHKKQLHAVSQTERYETVQDIRLGNINA